MKKSLGKAGVLVLALGMSGLVTAQPWGGPCPASAEAEDGEEAVEGGMPCGYVPQGPYGHPRMGGGPGYGGQGPGQGYGPGYHRQGRGMGPGSQMGGATGMMEHRLSYLGEQLQITEEQQGAWDQFKETMMEQMERMYSMRQERTGPPTLETRIEHMREKAEGMQSMASALEQLSEALDEEQTEMFNRFGMMGMGR